MTEHTLAGKTALVTGASRGFGRAISAALAGAGAQVLGIARTRSQLDDVRIDLGRRFTPVTADVTDPEVARDLVARHSPDIVVLNAGAVPTVAPIHEQTWDSFSTNWNVDARHVFEWTRASLRLPLSPGSVVIAVSSGAALGSSPLSGGYAPAKAAIRFISSYAEDESLRTNLRIRFLTLFPQLTPATDLGATGVAAYAARQGLDVGTFLTSFQPVLRPEQVGDAIIGLVGSEAARTREFLISGQGIRPVP